MYSTAPHALKFRKARESAGLSPNDAAQLMGISSASLWDIECIDDELSIYSAAQIQTFCQVLGITPRELFNIETDATPISATYLATLIRQHCLAQKITIEQFEDASGWRVAKAMDDPQLFLLPGYSIDGLQDICCALGVDWQRIILSL